jgi:hypothetical protein
MGDCSAGDCDNWVIVDDNGQRTLFQLVEVGNGEDAVRLASELRARAVVVDIALPALPALDEKPDSRPQAVPKRLIRLNLRAVTDDDANRLVRIVRSRPEPATCT